MMLGFLKYYFSSKEAFSREYLLCFLDTTDLVHNRNKKVGLKMRDIQVCILSAEEAQGLSDNHFF